MEASEQAKKLIINTRPLYMEKVKLWNGDDYLGYCHRISVSDQLRKIDKLSKKESISLLEKDIKKISSQLNKHLVTNVTQNQFDALVSLAYNIGLGAFHNSTLLRQLNRGNFVGASHEFLRWNKSNGKPLLGLTRRREREKLLFESL